ncbi:cytochrome c oxidase subunit 3 [Mucisphaera sp.]|uniref:cytochrome c oxidase subunit 3 n=1 Tax=Mucisphaera sp. TaxID=2913024 RepID=UPI003D0BB768
MSQAVTQPSPADHVVPKKVGDFGMWLFLASLAMLFIASMLAYVIVRINGMMEKTNAITGEPIPASGPAWGSLNIPPSLWISTVVILVSSFTIHRALTHIRLERQAAFRRMMAVTLGLAFAFLIVQGPSLGTLLTDHWNAMEQRELLAAPGAPAGAVPNNALYGAVFFLILVHALHVLGGIIPLAVTTRQAYRHRYDHEHHAPVKHLVMYWHFLDGVWIAMFGVLLITA